MSTIFFFWDIQPDRDREYLDFIMNDYLAAMARTGINMTDGWLKVAGEGPQIIALGESENYSSAVQAMESKDFQLIETRLLRYVENYSKYIAKRSNITSEGR
jgi:hypothetical protein